jgi:hypothetical protein
VSFQRITIHQAKKRFFAGEVVYFCPHKMRPDGPFSQAVGIHPKEWVAKATQYKNNPDLWKGSIVTTAWRLAYNNWAYYNASYEAGYYAAYYVEQ